MVGGEGFSQVWGRCLSSALCPNAGGVSEASAVTNQMGGGGHYVLHGKYIRG